MARKPKQGGLTDAGVAIFKKNARSFREAAGLSMDLASAMSGVSVEALKKWETRKPRFPSGPEVERVAKIYGRRSGDFYVETVGGPDPMIVPAFILIVHPLAQPDQALRHEAEDTVTDLNDRHHGKKKTPGHATQRGDLHR